MKEHVWGHDLPAYFTPDHNPGKATHGKGVLLMALINMPLHFKHSQLQ